MAQISAQRISGDDFQVTVGDGGSETTHTVTVTEEALSEYGGGASPEDLVEASFRFLLDREPKESILTHFDLPAVEQYFPEYADRIGDYL